VADGSKTVNGPAVQTRWGPVQVQVKIASGKITNVVVLMHPTGEQRDREINSHAPADPARAGRCKHRARRSTGSAARP
jgi:uncharacterized protein with FMN-binding domain